MNNQKNNIIEDFFNNLKIENQYYSRISKQPILLIGEKELYKAIKEAIEKANNSNNIKKATDINQKSSFKPLAPFTQSSFKQLINHNKIFL